MKRHLIFPIFLFLIALNYNVNAQTFKFANTFDGVSDQYGITGTNVFKLDSSGNSVWVKDFTGFIEPSSFQNVLISSAFDDHYLYVLELQGQTTSGPPPTYNPAIIKMDTLGNVLFVVSSTVQPGGSFNVVDIFPSLKNGVWVLDNYAPGFTHRGSALNIDSLGQMGVSLDFWYGSVASPVKICILPDSNYIACVNHRPSSPGISTTFPALTKFNEAGNIIWRSDYEISGGNFNDLLICNYMTVDSSGNTFMLCDFSAAGIFCEAGIKIDPNGNVLISNFWTDLAWGSAQSLKYENGELTCLVNGTEVHFDTLLNNTCLTGQTFNITTGNSYSPTPGPPTYSSTSFLPTNGLSLSYITSIFPDYCSASNTQNIKSDQTELNVYPNPINGMVNIDVSLKGNFSITISDPHGKICYEKTNTSAKKIDVSSFTPGIYIMVIKNESGIATKKFIVQ